MKVNMAYHLHRSQLSQINAERLKSNLLMAFNCAVDHLDFISFDFYSHDLIWASFEERARMLEVSKESISIAAIESKRLPPQQMR